MAFCWFYFHLVGIFVLLKKKQQFIIIIFVSDSCYCWKTNTAEYKIYSNSKSFLHKFLQADIILLVCNIECIFACAQAASSTIFLHVSLTQLIFYFENAAYSHTHTHFLLVSMRTGDWVCRSMNLFRCSRERARVFECELWRWKWIIVFQFCVNDVFSLA